MGFHLGFGGGFDLPTCSEAALCTGREHLVHSSLFKCTKTVWGRRSFGFLTFLPLGHFAENFIRGLQPGKAWLQLGPGRLIVYIMHTMLPFQGLRWNTKQCLQWHFQYIKIFLFCTARRTGRSGYLCISIPVHARTRFVKAFSRSHVWAPSPWASVSNCSDALVSVPRLEAQLLVSLRHTCLILEQH